MDKKCSPEIAPRVKKLNTDCVWWEEVAGETFSDAGTTARQGKEVFFFHPLALIEQLKLLVEFGISKEQFARFERLVRYLYTIAKDSLSQETCTSLAALVFNRIGKEEWAGCSTVEDVIEREDLELIEIDRDTLPGI